MRIFNLQTWLMIAACILGGLSDINKFDTPWWGFLILLFVYWGCNLMSFMGANKSIGGGGTSPNTRESSIGGGGTSPNTGKG